MVDPNELVLIDFISDTVLPMLADEGTWMAPDPAPLPCDAVERGLRAIMQSPNYSRQILLTRDEDGTLWRAANGVVQAV